jgi:hypothetical protein
MKAMGTLGVLVGIVALASPALGSVHHVHCDEPGQTITKALQSAQSGDTIRVRGTCAETVTITTDRVTLDGGGKAVLQGPGGGQSGEVSHGLLNIVGVQGVAIRGFTVQRSAADGINGRQGAAFTVRDVHVFQSADECTGLSFGGTGGLGNIAGTILSEHNTEGARAEDVSRIAQLLAGRMTMRHNTIGIIAENGSDIRLTTEATITDNGTDIILIFGSRGTFNGNTTGTITCDETRLVRGDTGVTCPNP